MRNALRMSMLLQLLAAFVPLSESVTVFNTRGIHYPNGRYVTFDSLDKSSRKAASEALGYSSETWNSPGTATIELLSHQTIWLQGQPQTGGLVTTDTSNPPIEALRSLGFDNEEKWDCYVNHYADYFWSELIEEGADAGFVALGWDANSWNGIVESPETENKEWIEMTEAEQQGAVDLCYLEETWSELPLTDWTRNYASLAMAMEGNTPALEDIGETPLKAPEADDAAAEENNSGGTVLTINKDTLEELDEATEGDDEATKEMFGGPIFTLIQDLLQAPIEQTIKDVLGQAAAETYTEEASAGTDPEAAGNYTLGDLPLGNYTEEASAGNYTEEASAGNYTEEASAGNYTEEASVGNYTQQDLEEVTLEGNYTEEVHDDSEETTFIIQTSHLRTIGTEEDFMLESSACPGAKFLYFIGWSMILPLIWGF